MKNFNTRVMILFVYGVFVLSCVDQENSQNKVNTKSVNQQYFLLNSEWGNFQKNISDDIKSKISKNINDTSNEFVAQYYESGGSYVNSFDKLISISFDSKDSLMYYSYESSAVKINGEMTVPQKQERVLWSNKYFHPLDTLMSRLNEVDFWNQNKEITVDANDGVYYCIIIRENRKIHYVLRWSPKSLSDSVFPKRKEFMQLCDLFKNLGKIGLYKNNWDWTPGQQEGL